ncbi:hypothetical protein ACF1G5_41940 [Streptomyces coeruleorubidus]|uniref:hypothetical protein n=1 Tax=Streptomyces coeruleorubidus TaxID=116188 RepID=UPI0036F526A1
MPHAEEMAAVLSDPLTHTFIGSTPDTPAALRSRYRRMTAGSPDPAVSWLNWTVPVRQDSTRSRITSGSRSSLPVPMAWPQGCSRRDRLWVFDELAVLEAGFGADEGEGEGDEVGCAYGPLPLLGGLDERNMFPPIGRRWAGNRESGR